MDEFDLMIKEIMIHRKPEHWLDDIFSNLTEYIHYRFSDYIFYKKGDQILFSYNIRFNYFNYDYDKIFFILRFKYNCNIETIDELIFNKVKEHLKINLIGHEAVTYALVNVNDENLILKNNG